MLTLLQWLQAFKGDLKDVFISEESWIVEYFDS